jgi:hypothetical protein
VAYYVFILSDDIMSGRQATRKAVTLSILAEGTNRVAVVTFFLFVVWVHIPSTRFDQHAQSHPSALLCVWGAFIKLASVLQFSSA